MTMPLVCASRSKGRGDEDFLHGRQRLGDPLQRRRNFPRGALMRCYFGISGMRLIGIQIVLISFCHREMS